MTIFISAFRWILWSIIKTLFWMMDEAYNVVIKIATFSITDNDTLWNWWGVLCCFIAIFVFFRVLANYLKMLNSEEYREKFNSFKTVVRIGLVTFIIMVMPVGVRFVSDFATDMIEQTQHLFVIDNDILHNFMPPKTGNDEYDKHIDELFKNYQGMPSYLLYSSMADGQYPPYQFIDINAAEGLEGWDKVTEVPFFGNIFQLIFAADGDYYYFRDTTSLIFLLVETVIACFLIGLIAIEIARRILDVGLLILISPYPISGLVSEEDESFSRWCKLLTSDLLNNFFQIILLKLVLVIVGSAQVEQLGALARVVFLIGGLMCVLIGPSSIASIIGGDGMGANQALQTLMTSGNVSRGIMGGATLVGASAMGAAKNTGALAVYGVGRAMGGRSLAGHDSNMDMSSGGGMGISNSPTFSSAASNQGTNGSSMNVNESSGAYQTNSPLSGGASSSFSRDSATPEYSTANGYNANTSDTFSASQPSYTLDGERGGASNFDYSTQQMSSNQGGATFSTGNAGITREGTLANKISHSPTKTARVVSNLSSGLYAASANRLFGQKGQQKPRKMQTASNAVHKVAEVGHIIAPSANKRNHD